MFITRATRHDEQDVKELLEGSGLGQDWHPRKGTTFLARDGKLVGCARLVEVAPDTLVLDTVYVPDDRRGEGIGAELLQAAMNSRGGTVYLCCHADMLDFYASLGFKEVAPEALLEPVSDHFASTGDLNPPVGHEHFFMAAR